MLYIAALLQHVYVNHQFASNWTTFEKMCKRKCDLIYVFIQYCNVNISETSSWLSWISRIEATVHWALVKAQTIENHVENMMQIWHFC